MVAVVLVKRWHGVCRAERGKRGSTLTMKKHCAVIEQCWLSSKLI